MNEMLDLFRNNLITIPSLSENCQAVLSCIESLQGTNSFMVSSIIILDVVDVVTTYMKCKLMCY